MPYVSRALRAPMPRWLRTSNVCVVRAIWLRALATHVQLMSEALHTLCTTLIFCALVFPCFTSNLNCFNYFREKIPDANPDSECLRTYSAKFVAENNYFSVKLHLSKSRYTTNKIAVLEVSVVNFVLYIYVYTIYIKTTFFYVSTYCLLQKLSSYYTFIKFTPSYHSCCFRLCSQLK